MKTIVSVKMIGLFLVLCINSIHAQTETEEEKLMNALRIKSLSGDFIRVQNIDSVNYRDNNGRSLLMYASGNGYARVCRILIR